MAKENEKKSHRSFELEKKSQRSFDLNKKPTRSFDLSKDEGEEVTPTPPIKDPPTPPIGPVGGGNGGSKKTWLWVVLGIIILAVLAYLFIPGGSKTEPTPTPGPTAPPDTTVTELADTVKTDSTTEAPPVEVGQKEPQGGASSGSVEEQAQQVIQGTFGNNPERRNRLGADYEAVQQRVNELMRQQY